MTTIRKRALIMHILKFKTMPLSSLHEEFTSVKMCLKLACTSLSAQASPLVPSRSNLLNGPKAHSYRFKMLFCLLFSASLAQYGQGIRSGFIQGALKEASYQEVPKHFAGEQTSTERITFTLEIPTRNYPLDSNNRLQFSHTFVNKSLILVLIKISLSNTQ